MKSIHFIQKLDEARVTDAIQRAELTTSGEVRVFVSSRRLRGHDVISRATEQFEKLAMTETADRNGVLLYFIPEDRQFAVIGDKGIHDRCGNEFWDEVAEILRERLAAGDFTGGVVHAVARAGEILSHHFPEKSGDENELPNDVGSD